jgi:hypothetical protein
MRRKRSARLRSPDGKARGLDPMESVVMSVLVELEQEIEGLRKKVEELEKRDTHPKINFLLFGDFELLANTHSSKMLANFPIVIIMH